MIKKLIKYCFGGISNTIISYFVYCILNSFIGYKTSYFLSLIISLIYIFQINTRFVFKLKIDLKNSFLFFSIYTFQLFLGIFLLDIYIKILLINEYIAPLINLLLISPIFFLINNYLSNYLLKRK